MAQLLVSGLLVGGVYALVSLGLSLIFGVMDIVNFAHGEFLMLAMYATFFAWSLGGLDPYVALPLVTLAMGALGLVVGRWLVRPLVGRPAAVPIFVTVGLSLVLQSLALWLWGASFRTVRTAYGDESLPLGPVQVSVPRLVAFAVALAVAAGLFAFLRRTDLGRAIRATIADRTATALMGVDVDRVFVWTFALGIALTGVAGALLAPIFAVFPTAGLQYVLVAFVAVVLGGLGSLPGAVLGGLAIGVVETLSGFYVDPSTKQLVYFLLFIAVLAVRPTGLLGKPAAWSSR